MSFLRNHPRGMVPIFFTEMWERFGFYILMAVLTLYMDQELGWPDSQKGTYYGAFLFAVYFFPLLGGWIGDRWLGPRRTIELGALSMLLAYLALAASSAQRVAPFYLGLGLVAFGTGIFKVNMAVLVGNLYQQKPDLRDAGFNIYYMSVNLGATIAPLAATGISLLFHSYRMSFLAAAAGMALALLVFELGKKQLKAAEQAVLRETRNPQTGKAQMPADEVRMRIGILVVLFLIISIFWMAFYQNGYALTLFAQRSTRIYRFLRPETYQFFNPFFILVLTPPLLSLFARLRRRGAEPSTPRKMIYGMGIMAGAMMVMVLASVQGGNLDQNIMSPLWLITSYLLVTLAEIMISPMGQSYVSRVAPPRYRGVMMGGWFVATALGGYGSGLLGRFYSDFPHHQYFLLLCALLLFSGLLIRLILPRLEKITRKA